MQIFYSNDIFQTDECIACIGFFDGVHKGHRFLLDKLKETASEKGLKTAIVTFHNHPRKVIDPSFDLKFLTAFDEKISLLSTFGIDYCYVLDFNSDIRNLSSYDFMRNILSNKLNAKALLIGYDHKFGNDRQNGFDEYKVFGLDLGIDVINSSCYAPEGKHISSSEIRKTILNGDIAAANNMLDSVFKITGTVVEGNKIGRTIGFPTANISLKEIDKIIPNTGVYASYAEIDNTTYPAMLNIGIRPTIEKNGKKTIEAHIIGYDGNLYGKEITISFIDKIREEISFSSILELKNQLQKDKVSVLRLLL